MTSSLAPLEAVAVIDLPAQGTPEWLEWRRKGIGSSAIPVIMGENDTDDTRYKLWRRITGRDPEVESNWAMTRGTEQEPRARALYELQVGIDTPPSLVIHPDLPWARVSLDGYNEDESLIAEFKFTGAEKHELARSGQVPKCYVGQVQWQLFVTGAKRLHYVSLEPKTADSVEIVSVTRDLEYWARMIPAAEAFWKCVETDTPPALTAKDFKVIEDPGVFARWKLAKLMTMQIEDALEELKARQKEESAKLEAARVEIEALAKTEHPKLKSGGVKVITVQRKNGPSIDIRLEDTQKD